MKIITVPPRGMFAVNSCIVVSDAGSAVLIDAPQGIYGYVAERGIKLKKILLTHGHCDHIEGLAEAAEKTGAEVFIHRLDEKKLGDSFLNLSDYFSDYLDEQVKYSGKASAFDDGDIIEQDELKFKVMHTPGHTSGSVCFVTDDVIFSGDTLFRGSVGRTDMPDGDTETLFKSLKKLADFTGEYDDYRLISGHGNESSLSREKRSNPYLR